jgi:hypothetical protein
VSPNTLVRDHVALEACLRNSQEAFYDWPSKILVSKKEKDNQR